MSYHYTYGDEVKETYRRKMKSWKLLEIRDYGYDPLGPPRYEFKWALDISEEKKEPVLEDGHTGP